MGNKWGEGDERGGRGREVEGERGGEGGEGRYHKLVKNILHVERLENDGYGFAIWAVDIKLAISVISINITAKIRK